MSVDLIVPADVQKLVIGYLTPALLAHGYPVPVTTQLPSPRPDRCVVAFRTGGLMRTMVSDAAQVTFDSRALRDSDAAALANLVRGLITALPYATQPVGGVMVYHSEELAGPASLPDPKTPGQYRYRQSFVIDVGVTILEV